LYWQIKPFINVSRETLKKMVQRFRVQDSFEDRGLRLEVRG
jgi:hypothetical protein